MPSCFAGAACQGKGTAKRSGGAVVHEAAYPLNDARDDVTYYAVPFAKLAKEHVSDGAMRKYLTNMIYVGVVAQLFGIPLEQIEAARLGGCPLAEHGVGRSSLKQTLLTQFYGEHAIDEMRAIKAALDPDHKLSPGVIFGPGKPTA